MHGKASSSCRVIRADDIYVCIGSRSGQWAHSYLVERNLLQVRANAAIGVIPDPFEDGTREGEKNSYGGNRKSHTNECCAVTGTQD